MKASKVQANFEKQSPDGSLNCNCGCPNKHKFKIKKKSFTFTSSANVTLINTIFKYNSSHLIFVFTSNDSVIQLSNQLLYPLRALLPIYGLPDHFDLSIRGIFWSVDGYCPQTKSEMELRSKILGGG